MANALKQIIPGTPPYATDMDQFRQALTGVADVGTLSLAAPQSLPSAPTLTLGSSGVLNGAYKYQIVAVTGWKENNGNIWVNGFAPGAEGSITASNQQVVVTIPALSAPVVAYLVYRTVAGGASGTEKFAVALSNGITSWTDTIPDSSLGTGMPSWNGTAIPANVPTSNTTGTSLAQLTSFQTTTTRHQYLFDDVIQGTTQYPTFTNGQITQILHKDSGGNTVRTDTFTYTSTLITETRTLSTSETLTLQHSFDSSGNYTGTVIS